MADVAYNNFARGLAQAEFNLNGVDDIRAALLMTNTDADTLKTAATLSALALDECDGANYVRKTLAGESVSQDDVNNRAEFTFTAVTWTALGNGTRQLQGVLIYKHVTNDTDSIPLFFIEFSPTQNPGGTDFTLTPNAEGALQITTP